MRLGLVTDVHNHALELAKALALLHERGVDQIVAIGHVGDPFAKSDGIADVAEMLTACGAVGVWGNHDFTLCRDVLDEALERYPASVFKCMETMQPRLVIENCHFSHKEASIDAFDLEQLWEMSEGPLDLAMRSNQAFAANQHEWQFVGHYHRWWSTTPGGKIWRGNGPLEFASAERYFVVVAAVCDGWCALLDTEHAVLEPIWCGLEPEAQARG